MTAPDDSRPETLAELAHVRQDIEAIDRRIIGLLAERLALGKRTAALKHASGLPILDAAREAEVIRRSAGIAREHGVPAEPVREIFWHIVGMSRRMQERDAAP